MKCQNCSWSWKIEKDDNHPFLCHKCGYDSDLNDFDMFSFMKWKKENGYLNESDPKVGTGKKPKGSGRRLYTDENPNDTVSVKFRTKEDIVDTLNKSSFKNKSHKRQSQIINLIHQRVRAAYNNAKNEETKKRLKRGLDYITDKKEKSKEKTKRQTESYLPFDEYIEEGYHIRTFYDYTDDMELVWHRDKEDRIVESVGDTDWMIQLDNELPIPLTERTYIPKETQIEDWLADQVGVTLTRPSDPSPLRAHRRCSNALLERIGFQLSYPTWRQGYEATLGQR